MSQPLDQYATIDPLGEQRDDLGEFFLANPWQQDDHNLSSYERNRLLLNRGEVQFDDVSHLSAADADSDSRSAVIVDLNNDGMEDLIVRSVGGGPLRVFQNQWPAKHWLKLSLRGTQSNSLGLGSTVSLRTRGGTVTRSLFPVAAYQSQTPAQLYFGMGDAESVESLTIRWPSGMVQEISEIPADQHILVSEARGWTRFGDSIPPPESAQE